MPSFLLRPLTALLAVIMLATSIPDEASAADKKKPTTGSAKSSPSHADKAASGKSAGTSSGKKSSEKSADKSASGKASGKNKAGASKSSSKDKGNKSKAGTSKKSKNARNAPAAQHAAPAARRPPRPAKPLDKAMLLSQLYADYREASLQLNPLQATLQGDTRFDDQLPNYLSADFRARSHAFTEEWLDKAEAIGTDGLQGQDLLSYEIFVHDARTALEGERFPNWMLPINPYTNIASVVVMLGSGAGAQPFVSVRDYDNWLRRADQVPALFDQAIANMREGIAAGVTQPRPMMEQVLPQLDAMIRPNAEQTLFWTPISAMPADIPAADRTRLAAAYRQMIDTRLMPAYRRLRGFIASEYLPACRGTTGLSALPDGAAWYAWNVHQATTTSLSPDEVHALGLGEVARLHAEVADVMKQLRFRGSMSKFFRYMRTDKRFAYASDTALIDRYRMLQASVARGMPALFSLRPETAPDIRAVEPYRIHTAAALSYVPPAIDGSRPGLLYVNAGDLANRRTWEAAPLYLHEAVPGHHVQLSLQQQLKGLPTFRRLGGETAFVEGWGLYAETLGQDLGLYQDPYDRYGYLQDELLRSARLVVDTGLHAKGWTREQAIRYLLDNTDASQDDATAEVERSMAMPGQVLAYKVGELRFIALREKARAALGPRFDVRDFHAEVLKDGSMPLDVLDTRIDRWIAERAASPAAAEAAPAAVSAQ